MRALVQGAGKDVDAVHTSSFEQAAEVHFPHRPALERADAAILACLCFSPVDPVSSRLEQVRRYPVFAHAVYQGEQTSVELLYSLSRYFGRMDYRRPNHSKRWVLSVSLTESGKHSKVHRRRKFAPSKSASWSNTVIGEPVDLCNNR